MVGVGDSIGSENAANLFQTIRADGVIVKPDVPIVPLDSMYVQDAQQLDTPMVASTYTDHAGMKAAYVFAYKRGKNTKIHFDAAELGLSGKVYVYNYLTHSGTIVAAGEQFTADIKDVAYYIVAPVAKSGIAFLGDAGKFVSLGKKRILTLSDDGQVQASIAFAKSETSVTIYGYAPSLPIVLATKGSVGAVEYNPLTHLFRYPVFPAADGSAQMKISTNQIGNTN
jgi:hypothetical protein